jgi:hypothetical protein
VESYGSLGEILQDIKIGAPLVGGRIRFSDIHMDFWVLRGERL